MIIILICSIPMILINIEPVLYHLNARIEEVSLPCSNVMQEHGIRPVVV